MRTSFARLASFAAMALLAACGGSDSSPSEAAAASSGSGTGGTGGTGQGSAGGGGQGGAGDADITAICDSYCDCVGCMPAVYDGCVGFWDNEHMTATLKSCLPEYEALVECLKATFTCNAGMTVDQCDDERMALDTCRQ